MQCNMGSIITKLLATMSLLCAFVFFGAFPTHERMTNATFDLIRGRIILKDKLLAFTARTILDQRVRSFELMRCHFGIQCIALSNRQSSNGIGQRHINILAMARIPTTQCDSEVGVDLHIHIILHTICAPNATAWQLCLWDIVLFATIATTKYALAFGTIWFLGMTNDCGAQSLHLGNIKSTDRWALGTTLQSQCGMHVEIIIDAIVRQSHFFSIAHCLQLFSHGDDTHSLRSLLLDDAFQEFRDFHGCMHLKCGCSSAAHAHIDEHLNLRHWRGEL